MDPYNYVRKTRISKHGYIAIRVSTKLETVADSKSMAEFYRKLKIRFDDPIYRLEGPIDFYNFYMSRGTRDFLYEIIMHNSMKFFSTYESKEMAERKTVRDFVDFAPLVNDFLPDWSIDIVIKGRKEYEEWLGQKYQELALNKTS